MISKKLISLLASFSRIELNRFKKYLNSPFFNENELLSRLFNTIVPFIVSNEFNTQHFQNIPDKPFFWKKLYPNTPFDDAQMRRLSSELLKMAYGFLTHNSLKVDIIQEQIYLLSSLSQRKLNKHFNGVARQVDQLQARHGRQNTTYHYHQFLIEQHLHTDTEQSGRKGHSFKHLEASDYQLDCFYLSQKLKHYCDALSYKNFLSLEANIHLDQAFLQLVEQGPFLEEVSIKVYFLVMKMLLHPEDENYFYTLKTLLRANTDKFTNAELNTLYIYLKNYCIDTKINKGRSEYFVELFEIFEALLEEKILFSKGILDPQDYKNIITVGLHIKRFDWVETFIQQYTEMLPKDNQANALNYNLAKVYFAQQKYSEVIEQLQEVEYKQLVYALGGKLLLLKTYFELKEFIVLDSLVDSFRIYLRRNKFLSKEVKQQYLNVLRFVKKLSSLKSYDVTGIDKVKKQVNECKALADKKWILEKVAELESSPVK